MGLVLGMQIARVAASSMFARQLYSDGSSLLRVTAAAVCCQIYRFATAHSTPSLLGKFIRFFHGGMSNFVRSSEGILSQSAPAFSVESLFSEYRTQMLYLHSVNILSTCVESRMLSRTQIGGASSAILGH